MEWNSTYRLVLTNYRYFFVRFLFVVSYFCLFSELYYRQSLIVVIAIIGTVEKLHFFLFVYLKHPKRSWKNTYPLLPHIYHVANIKNGVQLINRNYEKDGKNYSNRKQKKE